MSDPQDAPKPARRRPPFDSSDTVLVGHLLWTWP